MSFKPVWGTSPEEQSLIDSDMPASSPVSVVSSIRVRDGFYAVAIYMIGQLIGAVLYLIPVGLYWRWRDGPLFWQFHVQKASTSSDLIIFSIIFSLVLVSLFARRVARRSGIGWSVLGFITPRLYWFVLAVAAFIAANFATIGVERLAGPDLLERAKKTMDIFASDNAFSVWPMVLLVTLIVPFFEEVVFRAILFRALATRLPVLLAGVLSVAVFCIVHAQYLVSGLDVAVLLMTEIAVIGGVLTWLYHKSGSIWPSVTVHVLNNSMAMAMLLLWPKAPLT